MSDERGLAPLCLTCKRFRGVKPGSGYVCTAYGINRSLPIEIAVSMVDHRYPFKDDGGQTYEPIDAAADADKATKADADYIDNADAEFCRDCTMFRKPNQCTAVEGDISRGGHCRFFDRADSYNEDSILSRFYGSR